MLGIDMPHNDALVLTVNINMYNVKRILIDPGRFSEIMYHNLYKKLDLPASQVKATDMPVFSFSGDAVWPIAIAKVLVRFILMDVDSPYNAIMGHSWLGQMRVVTSPYY